jgi:hypothetical protein
MPPVSRRSLLKQATLTGLLLPLASFGRIGRGAANDRLRLAGIGVGLLIGLLLAGRGDRR